MSVYMITYFLSDTCGCGGHDNHEHSDSCEHDHSHNHEEVNAEAQIIAKIKSLGAWARFMPEGFFVKTSKLSAEEIFQEVNSVANKGDIIFVTKINGETSACANPAVIEWLKNC